MNFIEEKCFEDKLLTFKKCGKWQDILKLAEKVPLKEKSRFLWAFPTKKVLNFIDVQMKIESVNNIISIGCGSGLLEWLIAESTGLVLTGLELDFSWWKSKYSPSSFIELNFTPEKISSQFLLKTSKSMDNNFAMLFCYFNNGDAFRDYIENFLGRIVILIGPGEDKIGTTTDPKPFNPDFGSTRALWSNVANIEIGNTQDFVVIWKKNIIK